MANPFEDDLDAEDRNEKEVETIIMEGFLCPMCIAKFNTAKSLLNHFNEHHSDETQAKFSSSIKGIIGKARKMFDSEDNVDFKSPFATSDEYWRSKQILGPRKSYWNTFKKRRDEKISCCVVETNKLLIRLDKLLRESPSKPDKKKQHERNVVEWVEDSYVKLCPNCAKSFNFSRRRHHCRLCGGIMCQSCSMFLDYNYAKQLVGPIDLETSQLMSSGNNQPGKLQRKGSIISLPSIPISSNEPQIRVCNYCKKLLDRRNQQMYEQHSKPIFSQIYSDLRECIHDTDKLITQYYGILDTLRSGESNYKVHQQLGQEVRLKLIGMGEKIDFISRKISAIGSQGDIPLNCLQKRLQSRIRISAANYLRNNLIGLPSIPSEEDIERLREERMREGATSNEQTKFLKPSSSSSSFSTSKAEQVSPEEGWTPEVKAVPQDEDICNMDPMLVQINRIKVFIDLAKKANKYDEASILEANLKELEVEYMMQSVFCN